MTRIVDTTIRLLSQQPLVGTISTARVLEVAEILDQAGFAALEVSGGGCFDAAVQKGTESPWERIRGVKARCRTTPLQMALRGRFLVGSRPLSDDLVRRFILCAAESGIEIFRLHDPLNDVENLESAAAAVREAGGRLYAGLAFSGFMPNLPRVVDKARRLAELGADHVLVHDPAGALDPGTCDRVINELAEASGLPVGLYCQGTGGNALAMAIEAARHGAEPIATAVLPVAYTLHRVAGRGAVRLADRARARARRRCRPRLGGVAIHRRARHVADAGAADPAPHHAAHRLQPAAGGAGLRAGRAAADAGRRRPPGRGAGGVQAGAARLRGAAAGPAGGRHPGRPGRAARAVGPALGRGVARHARLPVGHLRQPAPGDRAGGRRPRRSQRGRRSLTRSRPDAGRGAGRQRGGSAAGGAVRRRRQPAAVHAARPRRSRGCGARRPRAQPVRAHPRADRDGRGLRRGRAHRRGRGRADHGPPPGRTAARSRRGRSGRRLS